MVLKMVVPPSLGSASAVPLQEAWYCTFTVAGSLQAPAVPELLPSVKVLVVGPPALMLLISLPPSTFRLRYSYPAAAVFSAYW